MVFLGLHCSQHASPFPSAMSFACETVIRIGWPQSQHHARKSFELGIRSNMQRIKSSTDFQG
jgi:hypothetical protein